MVDKRKRASIGAGDIPIELDGEEVVLRPTWKAAKMLSTKYDGLTAAIERIMRLDIAVVTDVIGVGLGYTTTKRPPDDLGEKVYRTGMTDDRGQLAAHCIRYLHVLAAGGRAPEEGSSGDLEESDRPIEG